MGRYRWQDAIDKHDNNIKAIRSPGENVLVEVIPEYVIRATVLDDGSSATFRPQLEGDLRATMRKAEEVMDLTIEEFGDGSNGAA
jgi:hypothetical protein